MEYNEMGLICRFPSNFREFQLQYWTFYMLFISLLRVFTNQNFDSIGLIPPELVSWKIKVLTSALLLNAFRNCVIYKYEHS
jgi:hypothetical protein